MRLATRSIAFAVVVSLLGSGPLATFARAQQPAQPPAEQPAQPAEQAAPQPEQPAQPAEQAAPQPAEQAAQAAPPPVQPAEQPAQAAPQPAPQPAAQPQPAPTAAGEPQVVQEPVTFEEPSEGTAWYAMGATVLNVVYVPGKAITCVLGMVVGGGLLLATLGAGYKGSVAFFKEGCGGKWILTAKDLRGTDWILGTGERPESN